jgi:prepilin-type N-terminal cleavage/methylation domain-containing protein
LNIQQENGFSLIELLAVIGIFLVLSTISIISWNAYGPVMALNGAAQGLGDALELCMMKAHSQKNEYFVMLNYRERLYRTQDNVTLMFPIHSYVLVNDDGWSPTAANRTRIYNIHSRYDGTKPEFRAEWIPDAPDHVIKWRNNNMIESREVFRGPHRLGRSIVYQPPSDPRDVPVRIVFSHRQPYMYWHGQNVPVTRPIRDNERKEDPANIYLSNQLYKPGGNTMDNRTHLRVVRVMSRKVEVIDRPDSPV